MDKLDIPTNLFVKSITIHSDHYEYFLSNGQTLNISYKDIINAYMTTHSTDKSGDDALKNCTTCRYCLSEPPHTCDICTSLDNEEDYSMWEERIKETSWQWIPLTDQYPNKDNWYQVSIYHTEDKKLYVLPLYWKKQNGLWYCDPTDKIPFNEFVDIDKHCPIAYCAMKEPYEWSKE